MWHVSQTTPSALEVHFIPWELCIRTMPTLYTLCTALYGGWRLPQLTSAGKFVIELSYAVETQGMMTFWYADAAFH